VAVAQVKAQAAALSAEHEALASQRLRADELAGLAEQVRKAASANSEREARALAALERGSAEHGAAVEQRSRALGEREAAVAAQERRLEELKGELARLAAALEARAAHDREMLGSQAIKAGKENARTEALHQAVLAEREEMRAASVAERQALEEARQQRAREREAFLSEVSTERRRLAEEHAAAVSGGGFLLLSMHPYTYPSRLPVPRPPITPIQSKPINTGSCI